jgi:hypothetical protein
MPSMTAIPIRNHIRLNFFGLSPDAVVCGGVVVLVVFDGMVVVLLLAVVFDGMVVVTLVGLAVVDVTLPGAVVDGLEVVVAFVVGFLVVLVVGFGFGFLVVLVVGAGGLVVVAEVVVEENVVLVVVVDFFGHHGKNGRISQKLNFSLCDFPSISFKICSKVAEPLRQLSKVGNTLHNSIACGDAVLVVCGGNDVVDDL